MARPKVAAPRKPIRKPTKEKPPPRKALKPGRPPVFTEEMLELVTNYCLLGSTDEELAGFLDISVVTLNAYKSKYPLFLKALKRGKEEADAQVAKSLHARALGYSHDDVHISNFQGDITVTPIVKHYAPDPTSAIFWLKNRKRNHWRERTEHSGPDGGPIQTEEVGEQSDLNIARRVAFILAEGARKVAKKP